VPDRKRARPDDYFADWKEREALAEDIIPIVGKLARDRRVRSFCYDKSLVNKSVLDVMKLHRYVRQVEDNELSERETHPVLEVVSQLDLCPSHIDVGRLAVNYYHKRHGEGMTVEEYVRDQLSHLIGVDHEPLAKPRDVVLYGFGRIGRLVARILIDKTSGGDSALRLRAVVVRKGKAPNDLLKRASLLRRDSVHGAFDGTIRVDEERQSFVANGNEVRVIYADSPDSIDYTQYGIDNALVVDNTGVWRDEEGLSRHLASKGVDKVILTAPGKGDLKNIVAGINDNIIEPGDRILTAASCTTNAIVPPLKAIYDEFGIAHGHVETVHSYTNDQNLIDNYHKCRPPRSRRGAEHGDHRDRRCEGGLQGAAGSPRAPDGQRDPRPDAERVHGDPQPGARPRDRRGDPQRAHASHGAALGDPAADGLLELAGGRVLGLYRLACRLCLRCPGDDRQRPPGGALCVV
jgi:glyceraldehyde 3-phosphate dehydrogenase